MAGRMPQRSFWQLQTAGNVNIILKSNTGDIMPVHTEITVNNVEDEFRVCPACSYDYGFHTSFIRVSTGKDSPVKSTREVYRVILICPECGARYDVGWRVSFSGLDHGIVRTTGHQVSTV